MINVLDQKVNSVSIDNLENEINTQKTRIDNLASLEEGSTTGDAELIDARVGINDFIYPSVGECIRTSFENVKHSYVSKDMLMKEDLIYYPIQNLSLWSSYGFTSGQLIKLNNRKLKNCIKSSKYNRLKKWYWWK